MPSANLLTDDDVIDLTGYRRSDKQAEVLRNSGIAYVIRPLDGKVRVTWYNVNNPSHMRAVVPVQEEPDFSMMDGN